MLLALATVRDRSGGASVLSESLLDSARTLSVHVYTMAMDVAGGNAVAAALTRRAGRQVVTA